MPLSNVQVVYVFLSQSCNRMASDLHGCLADGACPLLVEPLKALLQRVHLFQVKPGRLDNQIKLRIMLSVSHHGDLCTLVSVGVGDLEGRATTGACRLLI